MTSAHRLTANISQETREHLDEIAEHAGVSQTEALRRLVSYGRFLYKETICGEARIMTRNPKTGDLEVFRFIS